MEIADFKKALQNCDIAVYDLDKTLVDGRVAQGIGKRFIMKELKRWHLHHVYSGLSNYNEVLRITSEKGEAAGIEYFANVLFGTGCADIGSIKRYSKEYIEKHELPSAREFITRVYELGPKTGIISSICFNDTVEAAVFYFNMDGGVGNEVVYDNSTKPHRIVAKSLKMNIRNGKDKLEMTMEHLGLKASGMKSLFTVGNDPLDHELMKASGLSAASPLADEETKELADIWIPDYRSFVEELEEI